MLDKIWQKRYHRNMRRFFGKIEGNIATVEGDEFVHLKTILRAKVGEQIVVYNGSENEYECRVLSLAKNYAKCEVEKVSLCKGLPKKNLVLFQALTKREKMELVLQKTVELGVKRLVPFESEFCTVKPNENKKERFEKLVISACKQCERSVPMEIEETLKFEELLEEIKKFQLLPNSAILFANERDGQPFEFSSLKKYQNIGVIVGSEGGFSQKEKEALSALCESVSLGERILRSETATIVLCGIASILGEN